MERAPRTKAGGCRSGAYADTPHQPLLLALLAINAVYPLGVATFVVLYAVLALHGLRAGEWGYGLLVTATGVGALVGRYFGTVFAALSILLPAGNILAGVLASSPGARTGVEIVGLGFAVVASGRLLCTKRSGSLAPPGRRSK